MTELYVEVFYHFNTIICFSAMRQPKALSGRRFGEGDVDQN